MRRMSASSFTLLYNSTTISPNLASFLAVIVYSFICVVGMYNTYKEYEKSKALAIIGMLFVWAMIYVAIKTSMY